MWNLITDGLSALIKPVTTIVDGWQQRKTAQLTSDLQVHQALTESKINYIKTQQAADISWEQTALSTSGWKSGYLTIILSIPMVLFFVPPMVPYLAQGFDAMGHAPYWYTSAVGVMIAADFGYRKFADMMSLKNGTPTSPQS